MLRRIALSLLSFLALSRCVPSDTLVVPALAKGCEGDAPAALRVASYNVKSGQQTSLHEVGDTIAAMHPDVLALQEVNVDAKKGGDADQVKTLAARLGYPYVFAAALARGSNEYGVALISRLPFLKLPRIDLRTAGAAEPRVAIDATLCVGAKPLRVLTTHADVWQPVPNIDTLAGALEPTVSVPTIVLGDLNVKPDEPYAGHLASHGLVDLIGKLAEGPTFWSDAKRLDYLFVDKTMEALASHAAIGQSKASDHYPVWADFELGATAFK